MEKWGKEELTDKIINACINVYKELGPSFLKNIYHNALLVELKRIRLVIESEKEVRVNYCGEDVGTQKLDLLVEGEIVVELKAVEEFNKKNYAQVRSYLKALKKQVGLLINFSGYKLNIRRV
jgi:GxxExxY protein